MNGYQCWFCGQGIELDDTHAVMITVENLWRWEAGSTSEDDPLQSVYAHSTCARDRMDGANMALDSSLFGEDD